jgi:hypothetical protein
MRTPDLSAEGTQNHMKKLSIAIAVLAMAVVTAGSLNPNNRVLQSRATLSTIQSSAPAPSCPPSCPNPN